MSEKEIQADSTNRRTFLKRSAAVAGAVTVGSVALYEVFKPSFATGPDSSTTQSSTLAKKSISADALVAYAFLGPEGDISTQRDSDGNVSQISYGPVTVQIARDTDGSVASIETALTNDSIKVIDTINRNSDGTISGVTRKWPSS